jgi:hypothetical protein
VESPLTTSRRFAQLSIAIAITATVPSTRPTSSGFVCWFTMMFMP